MSVNVAFSIVLFYCFQPCLVLEWIIFPDFALTQFPEPDDLWKLQSSYKLVMSKSSALVAGRTRAHAQLALLAPRARRGRSSSG